MDTNKLNELIEQVGQITYNCGVIKLNSDETDVEYLRIDNHIYDKEAIFNGSSIKMIRKLQEAKKILREIDDMNTLSNEIMEFIIMYHPICIGIRNDLGINQMKEGEIPCYFEHLLQTWDEWAKDEFKISGYVPKTKVKNKNVLMSQSTFISTLDEEDISENLRYEENVCPLYRAYNSVLKVKEFFNDNPNYLKSLNSEFKNIKFEAGKDRFPIIKLITKNKCTYIYDFRKPKKREACLQMLQLSIFDKIKKESPKPANKNRANVFQKKKTLQLTPIINNTIKR